MKLRIQGNSLRLRLTRTEVAQLSSQGAVEAAAAFGTGGSLTYRVQSSTGAETPLADFSGGTITVTVPDGAVRAWADGEEVGLYAQHGDLKIAVEKDFRCLHRAADEPDAYPNPDAGCK